MQLYSVLAIIASFIIADAGIFFVPMFGLSRQITFPVLLIMFIVTVWHGRTLRKRISAVSEIEDFETRVEEYEKAYRYRLQWNLLAVLILCILFVLTDRIFFFFFAIIQVMYILPLFPNAALFKRELNNDEIILY